MKILLLTFDEHEEKAIDKILAAISDCVSLEAAQAIPVPSSGMSFPGLEIRQSQHRVIQGREDVNLTRLEYSTPCISCFQSRHCPHTDTDISCFFIIVFNDCS